MDATMVAFIDELIARFPEFADDVTEVFPQLASVYIARFPKRTHLRAMRAKAAEGPYDDVQLRRDVDIIVANSHAFNDERWREREQLLKNVTREWIAQRKTLPPSSTTKGRKSVKITRPGRVSVGDEENIPPPQPLIEQTSEAKDKHEAKDTKETNVECKSQNAEVKSIISGTSTEKLSVKEERDKTPTPIEEPKSYELPLCVPPQVMSYVYGDIPWELPASFTVGDVLKRFVSSKESAALSSLTPRRTTFAARIGVQKFAAAAELIRSSFNAAFYPALVKSSERGQVLRYMANVCADGEMNSVQDAENAISVMKWDGIAPALLLPRLLVWLPSWGYCAAEWASASSSAAVLPTSLLPIIEDLLAFTSGLL